MSSAILQKARDFERRRGEEIAADRRPAYHLTPRVGWMNDPNGFSFYQGRYHIFYQYHPYDTVWGPMHWGHAVSGDLLHWEYLPAALAPDSPCDKDGCFSGSAAQLPDGRHLLLYTGVRREELPGGEMRDIQTQCVAVGDGLNYEKPLRAPVLDESCLPEGFSRLDFRDPKLWQDPSGGYGALVACRAEDGSGAVLLFHSDDGFRWAFVTVLDRCKGEYGKMWECPDFFELDGKYVLMLSPMEMQADDTFHCGHNVICFVGDYDPVSHRFTRESVQQVDAGIDFYATQSLRSADGRRLMTAWLQTWADICDKPADAPWFGQMTFPRELRLKEGRLIQTPAREIEAARGRRVLHEDVRIGQETRLAGIGGRVADLTVQIAPDGEPYRSFTIKLAAGDRHYTSLRYDPRESTLTLDRSRAGSRHDVVHSRSCHVRSAAGALKLRILLDRYSAEIFVNDGEQSMTVWLYTPRQEDGILFAADGAARVTAEQYELEL